MIPVTGRVKHYLELCKIRISLFSALSAATGFILARPDVSPEMIVAVTGVFVLACGACALNQYQERHIDSLMTRTRSRPLPSGNIRPVTALSFSVIMIVTGLALLSLTGTLSAPASGLFAVIWYNGAYTYLKKISALAAVPGALVGAIPPAIGWTAGGGQIPDMQISALCFFFFMWQVPHFWLLLLSQGQDYEDAGLPSLSRIFNSGQLARVTFIWMLSAAVAGLLIPLYNLSSSGTAVVFLVLFTFWFIWNGLKILSPDRGQSTYSLAFNRINTYMLLTLLLLNIDRMFRF